MAIFVLTSAFIISSLILTNMSIYDNKKSLNTFILRELKCVAMKHDKSKSWLLHRYVSTQWLLSGHMSTQYALNGQFCWFPRPLVYTYCFS